MRIQSGVEGISLCIRLLKPDRVLHLSSELPYKAYKKMRSAGLDTDNTYGLDWTWETEYDGIHQLSHILVNKGGRLTYFSGKLAVQNFMLWASRSIPLL